MQAGKRTLDELLSGLTKSRRTLEIPFFQRSYVWEDDNWERFLEDMQTISKDYFMGSVILKQVDTPSNKADKRLVVDGQQRLTTILIFFRALYEIQDLDSSFLFLNKGEDVTLQHNRNDIEIFEAIIKGELTPALENKYEKNKILGCYKFFCEREQELKKISEDEILNNLYFVGIDLGKDEDEQQIFDTINSLGVRLTVAELLKNELFKKGDEELYDNTWKKTFEKDEETRNFWDDEVTAGREKRTNIELFLHAFLLIKTNGVKDEVGKLLANYKKELKEVLGKEREKKEFIEELVALAVIYQNNIDSSYLNEDKGKDKDSSIARLNILVFGLSTTTVVPYILYVLKFVEDETEQKAIFSLLESYLIRRLVCKKNAKGYNKTFSSFVEDGIDSLDKLHKELYKSGDPTSLFPHDDDFKKGFQESELSNQQAKIILYLIEKSIQDGKDSTILRPASEYTLEHMMPKKWKNNWATNLSPEQIMKREHKRPHLKLGNLTIITKGLNASIRDAAWKIKKEGTAKKEGDGKKKGVRKKEGLAHYSKGIKNMNECLEKENWDEAGIKERGEWLYNEAKKIWKGLRP